MKKIVLASASPRRTEILKMLGINHQVLASNADEKTNGRGLSCREMAMKLSYIKAEGVARRLAQEEKDNCLIIGADTIVTFNPDSEEALGKPADKEDAVRMLKALSGRRHYVITGVTVIDGASGEAITDCEITAVDMTDLSDALIHWYVNSGEPADKAGAYGIQGLGSVLVKRIEGCYFNVVGLPVGKTLQLLEKFGFSLI